MRWLLVLVLALAGCEDKGNPSGARAVVPKEYTYEVVKIYPHDASAYTQGLIFLDGTLYESTGLNGESSLRQVELESGKVLKKVDVSSQYFAEGLTELNGKLYQLTWQEHRAFVYDLKTLQREREFAYQGEGWGLATDGKQLIMSDGTAQIRFIDPVDFSVKRTINVTDEGRPLTLLNELEMVNGEIFANVWGQTWVARIDPKTGVVTGRINFSGLLRFEDYVPG